MKKHGDLILGFDLVQVLKILLYVKVNIFLKEEDKFKSIFEMAEILIKKEEYIKEAGIKLDFVLHGFAFNFQFNNYLLLKVVRV